MLAGTILSAPLAARLAATILNAAQVTSHSVTLDRFRKLRDEVRIGRGLPNGTIRPRLAE